MEYKDSETGGDFELAVFVQHKNALKSDLMDRINRRAKGEMKAFYTGRVDARAWYRKPCNPLMIGCSCGHYMIGAGTLGCFVRDRATRARGVLSNNHVLAKVNQAMIGDDVLQPGALDGGKRPADVAANLRKFIPIILGGIAPNFVDCAFAQFPRPQRRRQDLHGVRDTAGTVIGRLKPAAAIAAMPGLAVLKTGRTTGHTKGLITAVNVNNVRVDMGTGVARFDGQIAISSAVAGQRFSDRGDSGSLIMSSAFEPAALLFAGSSVGGSHNLGVTFANPIAAVLNALGVDII